MLMKKRLYFMCFKVERVESRSANLMDHKLHIFCQDNICDTQPFLAAFFLWGCWNCSGYHPSQGLPKSSPSTVGCLLVKHTLSQPNTELPYCKTGFCTHALMHTKDTSRKVPVSWSCAVDYIVWEHWADLAGVFSTFLELYKLPGLYGCKVLGTLTWIILMFCRLRFDQWTFQFKGLYPGFLHLFPCIILICVILLTSGEYLCFYD